MVKLILCDLDGTLLNSNKERPKEFLEYYQKLKDKGIILGIATGRSYSSLKRDFPEIIDDSAFILEGGSTAIYKGKVVYQNVIDKKIEKDVIKTAINIPDTIAIICNFKKAYVEKFNNEEYLKQLIYYYPEYEMMDNVLEVDDDIIKITIYDEIDSETNAYPHVKKFEEELQVTPSGRDWVDICVKGVNKGSALKALFKYLNINKDEAMAFGDFLNDKELLENVTYSYAMKNAHQDIKDICKYECDSNDNNGVMKVLKKEFNL